MSNIIFSLGPVKVNVSTSQVQFPEGGPISLRCSVTGSPAPRVTWYKDDSRIEPDDRTSISSESGPQLIRLFFPIKALGHADISLSGSYELTISPARAEDSGNYRCEAVNQYSSSSESVDIRVAGNYQHYFNLKIFFGPVFFF